MNFSTDKSERPNKGCPGPVSVRPRKRPAERSSNRPAKRSSKEVFGLSVRANY
ncbi:hypothetical protein LR48_Vigan670s000200 [Vigna angularis]|uniref:Uncharacterized protein n=1 Tax=Phaseolus angularis TaxID=3914 RepID=A0A0L9TFP3_PHAAN|nr:hypothetical protein LR48_Vigan670s000200 [Vigna angularis]